MIGLDTNTLVRYFAEDDAVQLKRVDRLISICRNRREPLFISVVALCETLWVLERQYGRSKTELLALVEALLETDPFHIEAHDVVQNALREAQENPGSFADHLIGQAGLANGCSSTATFDVDLHGVRGFRRV